MKFWIASMECADIAEAGGVKNVTYSLCKELNSLGNKVTLFIPVYKCSMWKDIQNLQENLFEKDIFLCGKNEKVTYSKGQSVSGLFDVVFVNHPGFLEKEGVYTYTAHEELLNPENKKGSGHKDAFFLDTLFQKSVAEYSSFLQKSEIPDIIHCQDASTALIPAFVNEKRKFSKTKTVVTIHNAGPGYHHDFSSLGEACWYTGLPVELLEKSLNKGKVEPFLVAGNSNAALTTVSEYYAKELLDKDNVDLTGSLNLCFLERNYEITGITNGFDFDRYNPENKYSSMLPFEYNPENKDLDGKWKCRKFFIQNVVNTDNFDSTGIKKYGKLECSTDFSKEIYFAYHGRITSQKGLSTLVQAIPAVLDNFDEVRFVITGQGESVYEDELIELTKQYHGKVTFLNGYNRSVARMTSASCDFIVLPSVFEPCGLEDFISQSFGTIPVAHKTGGLNKIDDEKTGFLYKNDTKEALIAKLSEVIMIKKLKPAQIQKMIKNAASVVHKEYYWKNVISKKYIPFYKNLLKK